MNDIKNIPDFLKSKDIKPSFQRIKIFEYLVEKRNHPTVDMIYSELISSIPTLSKTTVYNTLKLFIDKKIVSLLTIEENETRYDADTSYHGHFKCLSCGKIYDIDLTEHISNNEQLNNMTILEHHIYFKGYCNKNKQCIQNTHKN